MDITNMLFNAKTTFELVSMLVYYASKYIVSGGDFQISVMKPLMAHSLHRTTSSLTSKGIDALEDCILFSNHSMIYFDSAALNYLMHLKGKETSFSVIGSNLTYFRIVRKFFDLNKGIVVKRGSTKKEQYQSAVDLSETIYRLRSEGKSVWIAQSEGRSKDGNYVTEKAVLSMLQHYYKKQNIPGFLSHAKIVPVAVSYQYDPLDAYKSRAVLEPDRVKGRLEDPISIFMDFIGYKGGVEVAVGKPISSDENIEAIKQEIDQFIAKSCRIWDTNEAAYKAIESGKVNLQLLQGTCLEERILNANLPTELKKQIVRFYAQPLINYLKAKQ